MMRLALPTDRTLRVLLFVIALGVWTFAVAAVSRADDHSSDFGDLEAQLDQMQSTLGRLESQLSDLDTEVQSLKTAILFR